MNGIIKSKSGGFKFPDGTIQTTAATSEGGSRDGYSLDAADGSLIDALYVDSMGNVGIGTTNPIEKLHVKSQRNNYDTRLILEGDKLNNSDAFMFFYDKSTPKWHIGWFRLDDTFSITESEIAERLTIKPGGNVGIGTTKPEAKLDIEIISDHPGGDPLGSNIWFRIKGIYRGMPDAEPGKMWIQYGSQGAPLIVLEDYDDPPRIQFQQVGTGTEADPQYYSWIGHAKGESNDMAIMGGKIGIGKTNPEAKLDIVYGGDGSDGIKIVGDSNDGGVCISTDMYIGQVQGIASDKLSAGILALNPNGGNIGIGTKNPSYKLHVAGTAAGTSWTNLSDSRMKKNVTIIDHALNKVTALRGVKFEWDREQFPNKNFDEGKKIGLIAQEVEKTLPEVVSTDNEGYKSVEYANIVGVLIEAVKELKTQNEELRARIEVLENRDR